MTTASEQLVAPAATMIPVAALEAAQDEINHKSEELALAAEKSKLADEEIALLRQRVAAQEELNKALEAKKLAAEIRAEALSNAANVSRASSKARYRIILDEGRDKSDQKRVPVQVNGRAYDLQRGVELDVPEEVVSVLNDAVSGRAEPIEDPRTGILSGVEYVNSRRFPFQRLGKSRDEAGELLPGFDPI
jgi:hypothetical protein